MTNYKLEWRFQYMGPKEDIEAILENITADLGVKTRKIIFNEVRPRGRNSPATRRIELWMAKRTKPFDAKTFATFVGLSPAAAWRRLDRLVAAGKLYKIRNDDGTVSYSTSMIEED